MSSKILPFFNKKRVQKKIRLCWQAFCAFPEISRRTMVSTQKNFGIITLMIETACGTDFRDGHFGCV